MSPSAMEPTEDILFYGHRERVRALLRHLILEREMYTSNPLVKAYEQHLFLDTAYKEYIQAMDRGGFEAVYVNLGHACFRGCDLMYRYSTVTATSIEDDEKNVKQDE